MDMENQTTEITITIVETSTKPKDPLYRKYYQEKLKGVKHHCDICNQDIANKKATHATVKAPIITLNETLIEQLMNIIVNLINASPTMVFSSLFYSVRQF